MMKKKLMAVAVGAALAAPALSYAAVELSGRLNLGIGQYGASGGGAGDFGSRMRVFNSGSKIVIKASEDLGGGLSVESLIDTGINPDTGTANGQSNGADSGTGFFGSREAWVGLKGNFGMVSFGRHLTFYTSGDQDLAQAVFLDAGVQFPTAGMAVSPGVNRLSNSARYTSPAIGPGFLKITYATLGEADQTVPSAGAEKAKAQAVTYEISQGQFSGGLDYAKVDNGLGSSITGTKIRGGFKYQPGAQISLIYLSNSASIEQNKGIPGAGLVGAAAGGLTGGAAAGTYGDAKQSSWTITWMHTIGNIGLHAAYGKAGDVSAAGSTISDSSTTAMQFGVRFIQSKTTWMYVNYVSYTNGAAAALDFNAGGTSSKTSGTLPAGADPKSLAFGISHNF